MNRSGRKIGKMYQKLFFRGIPFNPTILFFKMYFKEIRIHERFSYNNEALFIAVKN